MLSAPVAEISDFRRDAFIQSAPIAEISDFQQSYIQSPTGLIERKTINQLGQYYNIVYNVYTFIELIEDF